MRHLCWAGDELRRTDAAISTRALACLAVDSDADEVTCQPTGRSGLRSPFGLAYLTPVGVNSYAAATQLRSRHNVVSLPQLRHTDGTPMMR